MESQHESKLHLLDDIKYSLERILKHIFPDTILYYRDGDIDVKDAIDKLNCVISDLEAEDV
jgi:hypothetical protein|tara:strand:+ start:1350 stop:1532 length:183 start_codon:yes stop_codon:yes gene_type:complete